MISTTISTSGNTLSRPAATDAWIDTACEASILRGATDVVVLVDDTFDIQHSFGSTRPALRATISYWPPLATPMYMFILQWRLPGTISAGPPGPCSILA